MTKTQKKYLKVKELLASDPNMSTVQACKRAKMAPSQFYSQRSNEKKRMDAGEAPLETTPVEPGVIVHTIAKQQRAKYGSKIMGKRRELTTNTDKVAVIVIPTSQIRAIIESIWS